MWEIWVTWMSITKNSLFHSHLTKKSQTRPLLKGSGKLTYSRHNGINVLGNYNCYVIDLRCKIFGNKPPSHLLSFPWVTLQPLCVCVAQRHIPQAIGSSNQSMSPDTRGDENCSDKQITTHAGLMLYGVEMGEKDCLDVCYAGPLWHRQ